MKLESKVGSIGHSAEKVYTFLSDFNNFKSLIPVDKVQNFTSTQDSCRFSFPPIGETGFEIIEKEPFQLIKISGIDDNKYKAFIWVQLKAVDASDTRLKLTLELEVNAMLQMMVKNPLQEFLNKMVEKLEEFDF